MRSPSHGVTFIPLFLRKVTFSGVVLPHDGKRVIVTLLVSFRSWTRHVQTRVVILFVESRGNHCHVCRFNRVLCTRTEGEQICQTLLLCLFCTRSMSLSLSLSLSLESLCFRDTFQEAFDGCSFVVIPSLLSEYSLYSSSSLSFTSASSLNPHRVYIICTQWPMIPTQVLSITTRSGTLFPLRLANDFVTRITSEFKLINKLIKFKTDLLLIYLSTKW